MRGELTTECMRNSSEPELRKHVTSDTDRRKKVTIKDSRRNRKTQLSHKKDQLHLATQRRMMASRVTGQTSKLLSLAYQSSEAVHSLGGPEKRSFVVIGQSAARVRRNTLRRGRNQHRQGSSAITPLHLGLLLARASRSTFHRSGCSFEKSDSRGTCISSSCLC